MQFGYTVTPCLAQIVPRRDKRKSHCLTDPGGRDPRKRSPSSVADSGQLFHGRLGSRREKSRLLRGLQNLCDLAGKAIQSQAALSRIIVIGCTSKDVSKFISVFGTI